MGVFSAASGATASPPESLILVSQTHTPSPEDDFVDYVQNYKHGLWKADQIPFPPMAITSLLGPQPPPRRPSLTTSTLHVYPSSSSHPSPSISSISAADQFEAQSLLDHYKHHGYFPAPKSVYERERLQTMKQYGLDHVTRKEAIDRICRLAKRFFKTPTVVITLIFEEHQVMAAQTGYGPGDDPGMDVPLTSVTLPTAVCTHALNQTDPNATFIIGDMSKDWRFKESPFGVENGGGAAFYASANIRLPTLASPGSGVPETLPVGTICVIDTVPREASQFSLIEREVLRDLADMVAREFQLGYEQTRRATETAQAEFIRTFLNDSIVLPSCPTQNAITQTRTLTHAGSAVLLDLRLFKLSGGDQEELLEAEGNPDWSPPFEPKDYGRIKLLATDGDVDWEQIIRERGEEMLASTSRCLRGYAEGVLCKFSGSEIEQCPFFSVDPAFIHETASCFVPIFDSDGSPALLLLLTSTEKSFKFDDADVRFLQKVGGIVYGSLLKQRVVDADKAKFAFLSNLSHDLRLPLHGVGSNIELIREFSSPAQLMRLSGLLDAADVCLESLRDVLDDTLEFAKLSNGTASPTDVRSLTVVDLEQLAEDVVRATWVRKRRIDLVSEEVGRPPSGLRSLSGTVEVILEVMVRDDWKARIDVGGMKRVLLNILGNSLKFTTDGYVKLRLWEVPAKTNLQLGQPTMIAFSVSDTGCGMSETFLRDALFTPFVQADSFANGAGLGMSICQTILKRMGGTLEVSSTLGEGTTMRVTMPVHFVSSPQRLSPSYTVTEPSPPLASPNSLAPPLPSPPDSDQGSSNQSICSVTSSSNSSRSTAGVTWRRRIISNELGTLLTPGGPSSATPRAEMNGFDFAQTVKSTQASLTLNTLDDTGTLSIKPSLRRTGSGGVKIIGDKGDSDDTAIEAAKLSLAAHFKQESENTAFASAVRFNRVKQTEMKTSVAPDVRVLVVEDNPLARNILSKLLSGKGVAFGLAENGQQAVDAYVTEHGAYNLILADVQMPVKDGITASIEIREYEKSQQLPRCRIIALSGLSVEADLVRADRLGGDASHGPIDSWLVKGGHSLRIIMDEIMSLQGEIDAAKSQGKI